MDALFGLLLGAARAQPHAPAVLAPGRSVWSYGDLDAASARLAAVLAGRGVRPGERVVVLAEKSPEVLALHLACVRLGAVFVPLSTVYTTAELTELLRDAEPAVVVADPSVRVPAGAYAVETLDAAGGGRLMQQAWHEEEPAPLDRADRPGEAGREHSFDDSAPAAMLYTSGTTGRPKGVVLSRGNLAANASNLVRAWRFTGRDRLLHVLPLSHTHGLFVAAHCCFVSGASLLLLPRFDVCQVVSSLPSATVFMGVPTHYVRLLEHPGFSRQASAGLRLMTSGSAPMLVETHRAVTERTGHVVLERYGMTEASIITANPYEGERRVGTVGLPLPGVQIRVVDDEDAEVSTATVGHLQVRGPTVFGGYWRRPGLREQEFTTDGWFRTGDLGRLDADGYVEVVGRARDLVITGGLNVYPKQVEQAILDLEGVCDCAVVGLPDPDLGERVVAVVVPRAGVRLVPDDVRTPLRAVLAGYKVPKQVIIRGNLPRNAMGKVEKARLRATLMSEPATRAGD